MALTQDIGTYGFGFLPGTKANREDLLDLITNVDPWDTPWVTQAPKVRAQHVVHEWLTDTLAATSTAGAIEGDDWTISTATTRPARKINYTQIFRKDVMVSETQRAVNPAGFKDAYAYEVQKATKELARNLESRLFVTSSATAVSGDFTASRTLTPFRGFITTTATGSGQTVSAVGSGSTAAAITATKLNDALERCYLNGGNPEQIWAFPAAKRVISQFSQPGGNRNIAAIDKKLINAVDFYMSDFGMHTIFIDRWIPQPTVTATGTASSDMSGNIWFFERAKNRLAWLRPMAHSLVGKKGDSVAGMVLGEVTLEVLNEKANFVCTAVNILTA